LVLVILHRVLGLSKDTAMDDFCFRVLRRGTILGAESPYNQSWITVYR